ncbi:MAG: glycosyltransferase family 4 protein [Thermoanaerobaculia bacterium]
MPKSSQQIESRPRLLLVGNFLSRQGQVPQLCEELADRFEIEGWSVLRTSSKPGKVARLAEMVVTAFRRRADFDLVQIDLFSGSAFVWAEIVALVVRAARKPFVLTLHGGQLPEFAARHPVRVRRLLRSAAVVTSPSAYLAGQMREFRSDIEVLPNPLDLTRFEFHPRDDPRPKLVWLRAFHEVYRPWLAVEVLGHLAAAYPGARLTMYGPDKADGSKEKTEAAIRRLGLEERVSLGGAIPAEEVPSSLQDGDIFLNTSKIDNAPRSVVEAMACGLCVVSTNVGGVPHLLRDGREGLLVAPDNPREMAGAVRRILEDPALAAMLSRGGLEVARKHDWAVVFPLWERLFHRILERTG